MESSFLEEEEDQQLRLKITDLSPVKDSASSGGNPPDLTCHAAASPQMRLVATTKAGAGGNKNVIEVRYRGEHRSLYSKDLQYTICIALYFAQVRVPNFLTCDSFRTVP
jgi:hypothetical protein